MKLFEELMRKICLNIIGELAFEYQGNKIDMSKWKRLTLYEAIKKYLPTVEISSSSVTSGSVI
jgi:lysyl-tRNA synthetase class II